jgi:hypothetical protein
LLDYHCSQAGGGLMNYASSGSSVTLTNSTISGNTATSNDF